VRGLLAGALLLAILAGAWALRADRADEPRRALSADERSYVRLAQGLQRSGTYGDGRLREPLHWAPGTPALFALATSGDADRIGDTTAGAGPARTAQAAVSTLTVALVAVLAWLVGGAVAGVVAGAAMAFYPPAIAMTAGFLSEPLGACTLALAALALAWAWRGGEGRFALAGVAFGLACLARADTLPAVLVLPPAVAVLLWRRAGAGGAVARGGLLALGAAAVLGPWIAHASTQAGRFVPVTAGSGSALYIATFLEGRGTLFGAKRALHPEACALHPTICHRPVRAIRAEFLLDAVAARHPDLPRDAAMRVEARRNLREGLRRPGAYAEMLAMKAARLWGGTFRGRNVPLDPPTLWSHRVLMALALAGLIAGAVRARSGILAALALALLACSALNVFFVAEARHNARMVPVLLAAGAAGWALALRGVRVRRAPARTPAPDPAEPEPLGPRTLVLGPGAGGGRPG
jgi:hypothetical protein